MAANALDRQARRKHSQAAQLADPHSGASHWTKGHRGTFAQPTLFLNISEIYILYIYIIFFC